MSQSLLSLVERAMEATVAECMNDNSDRANDQGRIAFKTMAAVLGVTSTAFMAPAPDMLAARYKHESGLAWLQLWNESGFVRIQGQDAIDRILTAIREHGAHNTISNADWTPEDAIFVTLTPSTYVRIERRTGDYDAMLSFHASDKTEWKLIGVDFVAKFYHWLLDLK